MLYRSRRWEIGRGLEQMGVLVKEGGDSWVWVGDGQDLFYINGNVVNKVAFCEALQLYIAKGCDVKDYFGSVKCVVDDSFGMVPYDVNLKDGLPFAIVMHFFFCCRFPLLL